MSNIATLVSSPDPKLNPADAPSIRIAEVVSALSKALDLSTGQQPGHSIRTCILGMRIGREYGLSEAQLNELYFALLLKDCGCSSNASKTFHALGSDDLKAKRDVKTTDWTRVSLETAKYAVDHCATGKPFLERLRVFFRLLINNKAHTREVTKIRCEQGALMARRMGLPETTADGIRDLDEHWDGSGNPDNLRGNAIHIYSRIMLLAQTLDNYATPRMKDIALEEMNNRSKKWFDPAFVKVVRSLAKDNRLWTDIDGPNIDRLVLEFDKEAATLRLGDESMDAICVAFAQIVDAKSPFTFTHSNGVAHAAVAIGKKMGLARDRIILLRHAALLHDLGKLGVPNTILEKPGKLDADEWEIMKRHPEDTWLILKGIPHFEELAEVAASHHEKLNGSGYFRQLVGSQMSLECRILCVADIFDALSALRPYRQPMPRERVYTLLRQDTPHALDADCVRAIVEADIVPDHRFAGLESKDCYPTVEKK